MEGGWVGKAYKKRDRWMDGWQGELTGGREE